LPAIRDARDAADSARKLVRSGLDPIDEKRAKREKAREAEAKTKAEARRERTTLARVARAHQQRVIEHRRTELHARKWISSLERHDSARVSGPLIQSLRITVTE
jgi:hypothetical protein